PRPGRPLHRNATVNPCSSPRVAGTVGGAGTDPGPSGCSIPGGEPGPPPGTGGTANEDRLINKMEAMSSGATAATAFTTPPMPPSTVTALTATMKRAPSQRGQPNCSAKAEAAPDAMAAAVASKSKARSTSKAGPNLGPVAWRTSGRWDDAPYRAPRDNMRTPKTTNSTVA